MKGEDTQSILPVYECSEEMEPLPEENYPKESEELCAG
jgi:hypothetical protein